MPATDTRMETFDPQLNRRSDDIRRWRRRLSKRPVLVFPAIVVLAFMILVGAGISGTSMGALAPRDQANSSVIAGAPKDIRSDEWLVRTPLVLRQVHDGFPTTSNVAVGTNDMAVLSYLPTGDWSAVFKPQLWGYFFLPEAQAFAFDWWGSALILLLGVYAFLLVVVRDWRWAAIGAVLVYAAPFFHWWHLPSVLSPVGFTAGGFAALLIAIRERRHWPRRMFWAGCSGFCFACNGLFVYPPFQIPVALVFGAVALAVVVRWWRQQALAWPGVLASVGIAAAIPLLALGAFYLDHRAAFQAIAATVYPGQRRVRGGVGMPWQFYANSWYSWITGRHPAAMAPFLVRNASEDSSFSMLGLFLLPVLPVVWSRIAVAGSRLRVVLIALLAVLALIAIHVYFGLPPVIDRITLLDRVPTGRAIIGIGLVALLLPIIVGISMRGAALSVPRRVVAGTMLTGVTVAYVVMLGTDLRSAGGPVTILALVVTCAAAGAVAAGFFWRPLVALTVLAGLSLVIIVPVNPLYRGLSPLRDRVLSGELQRISAEHPTGGWIASSVDMRAFLTANGFNNRSTVDLYPDASAWQVLDPTGANVNVWNRYAHVSWVLEPSASAPTMALTAPDAIRVNLNPCDPVLERLGIWYVIAPDAVGGDCFASVGEIPGPSGEPLVVSTRVAL